MKINELENGQMDILLQKDKIIILDFYTKWCPTCKMVGMTLEEYEEEHDDVFIIEIDAEDNKELANIYNVRTAPTLIFFYKGEKYATHQGFLDIEELKKMIHTIVKK